MPQKITPRQAQWYETLQDYNFSLEHFPGKSNTIADLLSRRKDFEGGVNINENVTLLPEHLFAPSKLHKDPDKSNNFPNFREDHKLNLHESPSPDKSISVRKIYLKDNTETRHKVLQEIHDTPVGGHPGISNTWNLVK